MSNQLWWATLSASSPRYRDWFEILGQDEDVPLKTPASGFTQLGEEKNVEVYLLDLAKMKPEQKQRLIDWIVKKFNAPAAEVTAELERNGFPIRAADVAVFFDMRAFL